MKSLYALKFSYANVIHQYEKANKKEFTHFDDESINVILEFGRLIVCRETKVKMQENYPIMVKKQ